jgi:peptidyl-prolyl cis-trans isomerase SurA
LSFGSGGSDARRCVGGLRSGITFASLLAFLISFGFMKASKCIVLTLTILLGSLISFAQDKNATVLTIAGENVSREEFENIFRKNNRDTVITQKSLDDYMELFVNFKLKVKEARSLGLDTVKKFRDELAGYRSQLARPYLTDNSLLDEMVKEAYDRGKQEVRARHLLIKLDQGASPEDTLKAWNRIMSIRERITKGENFGTVATNMSEDPSAKENGGDLGYFSTFQMVYPFEDAAYTQPIGQVTMPVRTRFGYHLLLVEDRRPARGEILTAHIMIKPKTEPDGEKNAETKINEIYQRAISGENFADLAAKFSEDGSSAKKGGELPWFGTNKMVIEFEDAAYALERDGDISKPFKTSYGWHIVKRLSKKDLPGFQESEKDLRGKVSKDSRSEKTRTAFINRLKKEYGFSYDENALKPLLAKVDTNVFKGQLNVKKKALRKTLYTIDGKNYPVSDFYNSIISRKGIRTKMSPQDYLKTEAANFAQNQLLKHEDSKLEQKHDAFRLLMNEYREGILLFELTDQKVWGKAMKDTVGLKQYYEENRSKFLWPERVDASIITCSTPEMAAQARKMMIDGKDFKEIATELNAESQLNFQVEEGVYARDDRDVLTRVEWKKGLSGNVVLNDQVTFVNVKDILPPQEKKFNEAKGLITSEYQNYLEQQWIAELRAKYPFTVNRPVLHSIK